MTLSGPTRLHHDMASAVPDSAPVFLAWAAIIIPLVFVLGWFIYHRSRKAAMHPQEHAFVALARKMRLGSKQIRAIRTFATQNAHCHPVVVLMNPDLLRVALAQQES